MSIFGRLISEIIIFLCIINLSNTRKSPLNTLTAAGLSCGRLRWDSLSAFGASLRPTLLAIGAIAPPKASLWSGKNNQYYPFSAGDNNTLKIKIISKITRSNLLIPYFTAYLIHYFYNS